MPAQVYVMGMRGIVEANRIAAEAGTGRGIVVNTTSTPNRPEPRLATKGRGGVLADIYKAKDNWETDLSPFHLGPCPLYGTHTAQRMENAWQFCKVYKRHTDAQGHPTADYWKWAKGGWNDDKPHRFPMGRGARPEHSLWDGRYLGYIDARKVIYAPVYAEAVMKTKGWAKLVELYNTKDTIVLRDFDGYRHDTDMMTLTEVLNCPTKIMGHAFVLKMLLTNNEALNQLDQRVDYAASSNAS
jgi:hypothetical protein